jgi:alpha-beta hydrolase superfamily lysophospholipase
MSDLFANSLHDEFGSWPIAYIPYGGADFGEIRAVAAAVGSGNDAAFYDAWNAAADRMALDANACLDRGHDVSARELFLRASSFYAASYHPLYGSPVDERISRTFRKQVQALDRGFSLFDHPIRQVRIPFEHSSLPAYLIPAAGQEKDVRPLIIFNNGYDGTITDMYFASAVAANRRGYHSLLFDGPGQGEMLYNQGIPLRPDWETVVSAVVDYAVTQSIVDTEKIALSGWSLGGLLAPRAASAERRIAALIADPGTWSIADGFREFAIRQLGVPRDHANHLGQIDESVLRKMEAVISQDPALRWKVVQRGFWVHQVNNLRDYLALAEEFTMQGRAELIRCPTLLTMAENDRMGASAPAFYEQLICKKALLRFTAAEGGGDHCEMQNRSLVNRRTLDWLDELFQG